MCLSTIDSCLPWSVCIPDRRLAQLLTWHALSSGNRCLRPTAAVSLFCRPGDRLAAPGLSLSHSQRRRSSQPPRRPLFALDWCPHTPFAPFLAWLGSGERESMRLVDHLQLHAQVSYHEKGGQGGKPKHGTAPSVCRSAGRASPGSRALTHHRSGRTPANSPSKEGGACSYVLSRSPPEGIVALARTFESLSAPVPSRSSFGSFSDGLAFASWYS